MTRHFALSLALALVAAGLAPARAADDPKAGALLAEVVKAYKALPAYADQGEFVLAIDVNGTAKTQKLPLHLTFTRPNKIDLDAGVARIVSDGKTLTTVAAPLKRYTSTPAPETINYDTILTSGPAGSSLLGGPSAPMSFILLNLLLADDPAKSLHDLGETFTLAPDRDLDGKPHHVFKIVAKAGSSFDLAIDPATKLVHAIDLTYDAKALAASFPAGQTVKIDRYGWTSGPVATTPADARAFAFHAPEGFAAAEALAQGEPVDDAEPKFKIQGLVGKPAPAFTLTLLDGADKTKTVTLADLKGKVVLIDFWATWCGPCLAELPEIQKLVESYAKAKKDVVVVALSQDNDSKDLAEVRKLVEATLKKKEIALTGKDDAVGRIGLDPSNAVGEAFKVEGYPTVVLIDGKGIVRSAHVGFSPEVGATLTKEIDALLAGKPIGDPKK